MSSSQLNFIFFRGVGQPPTRNMLISCCISVKIVHLKGRVKLRMDNSKSQHPFIDCFPMKIADFLGQNI